MRNVEGRVPRVKGAVSANYKVGDYGIFVQEDISALERARPH